jgi:hypothetical protein
MRIIAPERAGSAKRALSQRATFAFPATWFLVIV